MRVRIMSSKNSEKWFDKLQKTHQMAIRIDIFDESQSWTRMGPDGTRFGVFLSPQIVYSAAPM